MASKKGLIDVGRVLIDILAIAVKARLGFYGKNPLVAIADIKVLADSVVDASDTVKKDFKEDFLDDDKDKNKKDNV